MKDIISKIVLHIKLMLADEYKKARIYSKYYKINMGKGVRITGKPSFGSEPYLITIGDYVTITHGVTFHTHDGGVGVIRKKYPGINVFKRIFIGNNVFIGSNTTFLPGVRIGDNVVIGASSVITKNIPSDVVVAGIPAKIIRTLKEYEEKVLKEAVFVTETNAYSREEEIKKYVLENNE